ncbi:MULTISPECIES: cell division protein ZapB [Sulfurimonas]|uniref:Cell division protein ZapB n=1 Tax=Sulfurimonas diazotrophicus TaxID=3131939 RepID=A0ABZ3HAT9_9BACT
MLRRQSTSFELTLSLFAVIFLILGVTIGVLIPETKAYLQLQDDVQRAVEHSDRLQMEYDRLYEAKEQLAAEDTRLSERFENSIDATQLQAWVATVLGDATVSVTATDGGFEIAARVKTPMAFYTLIGSLDTAPWVLKVGPSVSMQADRGAVRVTFALRPLPHPARSSRR